MTLSVTHLENARKGNIKVIMNSTRGDVASVVEQGDL